ncbi:MAG TPA: DEAD/DEAH box helicase [Clostridiaceae bacterium]|jgi:ATP-dependent RNA helicase DeaD|nr:DEAD/DEAH box helicase [Clostridiaceae bacterium]
MNDRFSDLGVIPPILKALEEMGYEKPTKVQSKSIPHILNKEDLIVKSKTGSGKTAVYGISMLQSIDSDCTAPQGLILVPTRELAVQVDNDLKLMAKYTSHKTTAVYGQHNINIEKQTLENGISIVSGTPGRVFDHIEHGSLKTNNIKFLVLDEADRMLDMGFIDQVVRIIKTIPKDRITLLFSATIPPEVNSICRAYMRQPVTIEIESPTMTVESINQVYYRVQHNEKRTWLNNLLLVEQPESCIIFCNTRMTVDRVHNFLTRNGYSARALHGDIPQNKRLKTMGQFKRRDFCMLVATDVAARGIHVDDLALVINYDVPVEKDSYVHRIGRTGRAGNVGKAITLVTGDDIMSLYEIEEHIGVLIEEAELPSAAVIRECKENATPWLQAQSQKVARRHDYYSNTAKRKSSVSKKKKYTGKVSTAKSGIKSAMPKTNSYKDKPKSQYGYEKTHSAVKKKVTTSITIGPKPKVTEQEVLKAKTNAATSPSPDSKSSFFMRVVKKLFKRK